MLSRDIDTILILLWTPGEALNRINLGQEILPCVLPRGLGNSIEVTSNEYTLNMSSCPNGLCEQEWCYVGTYICVFSAEDEEVPIFMQHPG